jgi:hypothetical protein
MWQTTKAQEIGDEKCCLKIRIVTIWIAFLKVFLGLMRYILGEKGASFSLSARKVRM